MIWFGINEEKLRNPVTVEAMIKEYIISITGDCFIKKTVEVK